MQVEQQKRLIKPQEISKPSCSSVMKYQETSDITLGYSCSSISDVASLETFAQAYCKKDVSLFLPADFLKRQLS